MKYGLLVTGMIAAGVSAALLFDEKKGPRRRKMLRKKADHIWEETTHMLNDYARELKPYWKKYSKELSDEAKEFSKQGVHRAEELSHNGWSPSARMLGATASAMAFYGAGRSSLIGRLLRIVSLGLFTRALLASR